ncbi:MAG: copper homeostasis protein CutC, partial [Leeuwenhoekiella sp.]
MKTANYILEACIETIEDAIAAANNGAHRLEVCSRLDLDGLTPSEDLITEIMLKIDIPVRIMIRPKAGDFIYSQAELDEMYSSVSLCKKLNVEGVVFGISNPDQTLNYGEIQKLARFAHPLKVTIHKAIDYTPDLSQAVEELLKIPEITSILSSGGKKTALEGAKNLLKMVKIGGNGIEIVAAGRITPENIIDLHRLIGAKAYHGKKIVSVD